SGSAEVLVELGIAVDAGAPVQSRCVRELGIAFLLAPRYHPGLRFAAPVRKQLPFRTIFNLVGPLANPARPDYQIVGVPSERQARLLARAFSRLGTRRAAVVTGADGLDEVSLAGPTRVFLVEAGQVSEHTWRPEDFALGPVASQALEVTGPADSAAKIRQAVS